MTFPHVLRRLNTWGTPPKVYKSTHLTTLFFTLFRVAPPEIEYPLILADEGTRCILSKKDFSILLNQSINTLVQVGEK
jgi:hypothetical protein